MTAVTVLHEAEVELWGAVAYYEDKTTGLGLDFAAEIEISIRTICESPKRWPIRSDGTRRYLTHRFPFLIVYTHENDQVWILAIAHRKRRSGYWTHQ